MHQIPPHLPEGSEYNVFLAMSLLETGEQTGCYVNASSADFVCIDDWLPSPGYPLLASTADFLDTVFPPPQYEIFGGVGGEPEWMQWDCSLLRDASDTADAAATLGIATGAGTAVTAYTVGGGLLASKVVSGVGAAIAAGATLAGEGAMVGTILAVASGPIGAAVVVGSIVTVAILAGVTARKAYVSGLAPGAGCPGCGAGVNPTKYSCAADLVADLCTCSPVGAEDPTGDQTNNGTAGCGGADAGHGELHLPPWTTNTPEYSGCTEWQSYEERSEECEGCWSEEEEVADTPTGEAQGERWCTVCTEGTQEMVGTRTCSQFL